MTTRELFDAIREDYRRHGCLWNERAVWALAAYRFGNWADARPSRFGRRFFSLCYGVIDTLSQIVTGVTMNRSVRLGEGFHMIHTGALFIHPEVVIGDRVGIMQNVTLGTNMGPEVPVIGDDVFIGAGACVLGRVHVGNGARIAANSLVINDVPENAFAVGVPAKNMKARARSTAPRPVKEKSERLAGPSEKGPETPPVGDAGSGES